ncbi:MAG: YIP1 family protein [Silicimonas sp.]|nr:YIP1 family protein [Silicimonas sp.]
MTLFDSLIAQGKRAFREPRQTAADVLALGFPREALAPALMLVVVISVLMSAASDMIAPPPVQISYFRMALLIMIIFTSFSFAIAQIGKMMGGVGSFADSLLLAVFFQAIFIPIQAIQVVLMAFSPELAAVLAFGIILFGFWINVNFIAALHGFETLGRALGVLILASIAVAFFLVIVTPLLGISISSGGAVGV